MSKQQEQRVWHDSAMALLPAVLTGEIPLDEGVRQAAIGADAYLAAFKKRWSIR